jgi:hypothetical protein
VIEPTDEMVQAFRQAFNQRAADMVAAGDPFVSDAITRAGLAAALAERDSEARRLLEYALHLRMHGERAPGGNETWAEFDQRCEAYLRATS